MTIYQSCYLSIYLSTCTRSPYSRSTCMSGKHSISYRYMTSYCLSILLHVNLSVYLYGKSIFKTQHACLANILYLSTSRYLTSYCLSVLLSVYLTIYLYRETILKIQHTGLANILHLSTGLTNLGLLKSHLWSRTPSKPCGRGK